MRTLVYSIGPIGCGTKRLARAFASLGLFGGHEVIGTAWKGSVCDESEYLAKVLCNNTDVYQIPTSSHSDWKLSEFYYRAWANIKGLPFHLIQRDHAAIWEEGMELVKDATYRFLDTGEGFFFDCNGFLVEWWPFIETLYPKPLESRSVVLACNGRRYVQKLMSYGVLTEDRETTYGANWADKLKYGYPNEWPTTPESYSRFEKVCYYWDSLYRWLLFSGSMIVRVEDFNNQGTADIIRAILIPECTSPVQFTLFDENYAIEKDRRERDYTQGKYGFPNPRDWTDEMNDTFIGICGQTMQHLGYEL